MPKKTYGITLDSDMAEIAKAAGNGSMSECIRSALLVYPPYNKIVLKMMRDAKKEHQAAETIQAIGSKKDSEHKRFMDSIRGIVVDTANGMKDTRANRFSVNNKWMHEIMTPEQYAASVIRYFDCRPDMLPAWYRLDDTADEKASVLQNIGCPALTVEMMDDLAKRHPLNDVPVSLEWAE